MNYTKNFEHNNSCTTRTEKGNILSCLNPPLSKGDPQLLPSFVDQASHGMKSQAAEDSMDFQ